MISDYTSDLLKVISTLYNDDVQDIKTLAHADRLAFVLYTINKVEFPFYDPASSFYIRYDGEGRQKTNSLEDFLRESKKKWGMVLERLAAIKVGEWGPIYEEVKTKDIDRLVSGDKVTLEYFCVLILCTMKDISPVTYQMLESKHKGFFERLKNEWVKMVSGSKKSSQATPTSSKHERSPEYYTREVSNNRDFIVTDKSIQSLLEKITDLSHQVASLREDLTLKERTNINLVEKVANLKKEKKSLQDTLESKENDIALLNFKLDNVVRVTAETNPEIDKSLKIANQKIDDLYQEMNLLQRKNSDLVSKLNAMEFMKHLPREEEEDDYNQLQSTEDQLRLSHLEISSLKEKISVLDNKFNVISDRLLREKDASKRLTEQLEAIHRLNTQKEIQIASLTNENTTLGKELEYVRDQLVKKEFLIKKMDRDYNSIIASSESSLMNMRRQADPASLAEDSNLELIKICKEVNQNCMRELECVYGLLHDTFITELTGVSLDQIVKKRLQLSNAS